jgi:hypothetical protein
MIFIPIDLRSFHHKTIEIKETICPLCQQKGELKLHLMQKYVWCFLVLGPTLPSKKYGVLECAACNKSILVKSWSSEIKAVYNAEKLQLKTPLRFWRGWLILMCMLAGMFFYMSKALRKNKMLANVEKELQNIKQNDILIISDSTAYYGLNKNKILKVLKITGNKVYLVCYADRVDWDEQSEIEKDNLDLQKFGTEPIVVSLEQIKKRKSLVKFDKNGHEEFLSCGGINGIKK